MLDIFGLEIFMMIYFMGLKGHTKNTFLFEASLPKKLVLIFFFSDIHLSPIALPFAFIFSVSFVFAYFQLALLLVCLFDFYLTNKKITFPFKNPRS